METHPTPMPFGARGKPERVDRRHGGISHRLRHRAAAQKRTLFGVGFGEDGKLHGRIVKAGELQFRINRSALALVRRKRFGVRRHEIIADRFAPGGVIDEHEAPGLGEADRWRQAGKTQEAFDAARWKRAGEKMPDIAAPNQKFGELRLERFVEIWHRSPRHGQGLYRL